MATFVFKISLGEHGNWVSAVSKQAGIWDSSSTVIAGVGDGALTPDLNPQFQDYKKWRSSEYMFLRLTAKKGWLT